MKLLNVIFQTSAAFSLAAMFMLGTLSFFGQSIPQFDFLIGFGFGATIVTFSSGLALFILSRRKQNHVN